MLYMLHFCNIKITYGDNIFGRYKWRLRAHLIYTFFIVNVPIVTSRHP